MTKESILNELVNSCVSGNTNNFIPFLLNKNVKTEMPNKIRFYSFFKQIVKCAEQNSVGKLTLRIEDSNWNNDKNTIAYNFYDKKHKFARMRVLITEKENDLILETMPF